jgi:large subunit ribosomal protein L17
MKHQFGRRKLNLKSAHRKALLRNQVIHFIQHGVLQSTRMKVKEVQRITEKLVTIAGKGSDFNTIRRLKSELPYSDAAVEKMIKEIAPRYVGRSGGYTRVISLGKRESDTAKIARLEWV